jgi:hypothetical protein
LGTETEGLDMYMSGGCVHLYTDDKKKKHNTDNYGADCWCNPNDFDDSFMGGNAKFIYHNPLDSESFKAKEKRDKELFNTFDRFKTKVNQEINK